LANFVGHVTLLQFDDELKADAVLQRKLQTLPNVTVITSAQTTEVTGDGTKMNGLTFTDRVTGESKHLALDGVFVQIGLIPNSDWLKGTLNLSKFGEIEINHHNASSLPGVFAAGDVTTTPYKQIIIAMGEGSKAALGAFDYLIRQ
jgi:NADH-dependent peroxiredoxin subunit F